MTSTRRTLTLLFTCLAAALAVTENAAASPFTDAANRLRVTAGLAPVTAHSAAAAHAAAAVAGNPDTDAEDAYAKAAGVDPDGDLPFGYATIDASDTPARALTNLDVVALIADPRLASIDEAAAGDRQVIAVTIDPSLPWTTPLAVPRAVDLLSEQPIVFVLPPDATQGSDLQLLEDGRWRTIGPAIWPTADDSSLYLGTGASAFLLRDSDLKYGWLPFGARLRLRNDGTTAPAEFTTRPEPAAVKRRSFRFATDMSRRDRRVVLAAVRSARPATRRLIAKFDDFTTITRFVKSDGFELGRGGPDPATGGYGVWLRSSLLRHGSRRDLRITVLHELGHVVDSSGLRGRARRAILRTIPRRGKCPPYDPEHPVLYMTGPCAQPEERFADTFAKWALHLRRFEDIGYDVPAPRSFKRFGRLVTRSYSFRLYGPVGPAR